MPEDEKPRPAYTPLPPDIAEKMDGMDCRPLRTAEKIGIHVTLSPAIEELARKRATDRAKQRKP